jgi:cyanophycinase-like exopeptidase
MASKRKAAPARSTNGHVPPSHTRTISRLEAARAADSTGVPKGSLILVGGGEDREGEMHILREVAGRARGGRLAVVTAASTQPGEMWALYKRIFQQLGVKDVVHVPIENRDAAFDPGVVDLLKAARVIFFSGGDQVRITSRLGGSMLCDAIRKSYEGGFHARRDLGRHLVHERDDARWRLR